MPPISVAGSCLNLQPKVCNFLETERKQLPLCSTDTISWQQSGRHISSLLAGDRERNSFAIAQTLWLCFLLQISKCHLAPWPDPACLISEKIKDSQKVHSNYTLALNHDHGGLEQWNHEEIPGTECYKSFCP